MTRTRSPRPRSIRRVVAAGLVGSAIEWYDFFIFGTAAALAFGPVFFAGSSPVIGLLLSFATFWAGFVARPVGGILFGSLGDRIGRKPVLLISLSLMTGATVLIGMLPSSSTIGVAAPVLLVALRVVQGIAVGGQWGSAVLLLTESARADRKGRAGAYGQMGPALGHLLGSAAFIVAAGTVAPAAFLTWGWRIPFLASIVLVPLILFIHLRVEESPEFRELRAEAAGSGVERAPVREVLRTRARTVVLAAGLLFATNAISYVAMVGLLSYGTQQIGYERQDLLLMSMAGSLSMAAVVFLTGSLSDRIGRRPVAIAGATLVALWSFPFFWLVDSGSVLLATIATVGAFVTAGVGFGSAAAHIAELFPPRLRFSGATLAYQGSAILVSGSTPLLMTALLAATGVSASVSTLLLVLACVTLGCAVALPETRPGATRSAGAAATEGSARSA